MMKHNEATKLTELNRWQNQPSSETIPAQLMNLTYVLPLADPRATLSTVGGKGAALARLAATGLPVPAGFHVTTTAYQQFVAENHLQPGIRNALASVDATRPTTLENAAQAIQRLFSQGALAAALAEAIAEAYVKLPGEPPVVAVRSSATAEDLPELSFAGQQETFLNIQGVAALLDAVKRCWASLWTARAIGYRLQHGVDQETVSLAVVVQLLVAADASGILFTANPVNGRRDQAMISAAWGLGEAIVGGKVTPDTLVVEKASGQIVQRETANKQVMTVRMEKGTEERATPVDLRDTPVLDDRQAVDLVRLGRQIEQMYQMPMDIEWALAQGNLVILQARPITALPEPEAAIPLDWPLPDPQGHYGRSSIVEQLPDPLTPLFATLGMDVIDAATRRMYREIISSTFDEATVVTINDYAYLNYGCFLRGRLLWATIAGMVRLIPRILRESEQRWRDEAHGRYAATVATWRAKPLAELSTQELLTGVRVLLDGAVTVYTVLQSGLIPMANMSEGLFTLFYERLIKHQADPPAMTYLIGFDSTPILAEKTLYALAMEGRTYPDLATYVAQTPAAQLSMQLARPEAPLGVDTTHWQAWQHRVQTYLQRYGHTIYNMDFAKPVPADDPVTLLEICKLFLTEQIGSPYARQQKTVERREQAIQVIVKRLDWPRRALFQKLVKWAQKYAVLREDGLADLGLGYPLLRQMLLEVGQRFVQARVIERADDIFWLVRDEVERCAQALAQAETGPSLGALVAPRRATWRAEKRVIPPPLLPMHTQLMGFNLQKWMPARVEEQRSDTLQGVAASPGRVTATACVLHGPEDFGHMQPGQVLVAAITTPAWTPLFAMATGVVTDVGGPLSHGSIVAREYGIPAVLGTGVATQRIQGGDVITVDGSAGLVILRQGDRES